MTVVRRLALAFVLILLVFDGALLAFVKFGGSGSSRPTKVNVVAYLSDAAAAEKLKGLLPGRPVSVSAEKRETQVPDGFVVVRNMGDPDLAKPIAETLVHNGWKGAKVVGDSIQVGDNYPDQAQAQAVADKVEQKEQIKFNVEPGHKTVTADVFKLVVKGLDNEAESEVVSLLVDNGVEDYETEPADG